MGAPTAGTDRFEPGSSVRAAASHPRGVSAFPGTEDVAVARVFAGPGYTSPSPLSNPMATVALWMAIGGFLLPILFPVSTVLAGVSLLRASRSGDTGRHAALAALVLSLLAILLLGILYLLVSSS